MRTAKAPAPDHVRLATITVLAPVPDAALTELTERLQVLRAQTISPFGRVPGVHFARLAVMPRSDFVKQVRARGLRRGARLLDLVLHGGRDQRLDQPSRSYLLFSASYDRLPGAGDDADFLEQLRTSLGADADRIWGLCAGYPGWSDPEGFRTFFAGSSLPSRYVFSATDEEPSVSEIRSSLRLRETLADLALSTDGLPDEELAAALRAVLERPGGWNPEVPATPAQTPAGDLPATPNDVEPALMDPTIGPGQLGVGEPETDPDLADVQNLVTSGYPRHQASRHLLLKVTDAGSARSWLTGAIESIPTGEWAERYVDRLKKDLDSMPVDPTAGPEGRPGSPAFATHIAFSYGGLRQLGLPESELHGFATEFQVGMAKREAGLTPGRGTSTWQGPFTADAIDMLVMFSAADVETLGRELDERPGLFPTPADGLQVLGIQEAGRIPEDRYGPGDGVGKPGFLEHFGFVDGLSQPRVHGVTAGSRNAELPPGEALLGYQDVDGDTAGAGLSAPLARNGSYLVYRKLEQDVPAFRSLTRRLASLLAEHASAGTDFQELAAAKLMGRWRDGTPLTLSGGRSQQELAKRPFTYQQSDAVGFGCPVGAHIRRANPRDSRPVDPNSKPVDGANPGLEADLSRRHRMLRRGIPYGNPLPVMEFDDLSAPAAGSSDSPEERGLLFIALVGDIRRQFEFVQAHWMSDGNAFRLGSDVDLFSGAAVGGSKFVVQDQRAPTFVKPDAAAPLVTCRGGEYFFLPGISALRRIAGEPAVS
jgi:Dyp-type peroxidase family